MTDTILQDLDDFHAALAEHPRVLLFKHSPICPTSATAFDEWRAFARAHPEVPRLFVDVVGRRAVARGVAEACGVAHQSPQAILFRDGEPVWHASHWDIRAETLAEVWADAAPETSGT